MFRAHERTVPYSTIVRISQSNGAPTREEVDELRDYSIQSTWKFENLSMKFKHEQSKVKELEGQIRALKAKPDMLAPKKEKERKLDTLAAVQQRNVVLQKTLDDLRVVHEATILRLEKAEAKIREMENVKVEKLDSDLMDVPTKPVSHKGWIHDTVIAPNGFSE